MRPYEFSIFTVGGMVPNGIVALRVRQCSHCVSEIIQNAKEYLRPRFFGHYRGPMALVIDDHEGHCSYRGLNRVTAEGRCTMGR